MENKEQKLVNLTINGKAVSVPAGTSVIRAALDNGFFIPHYCYHEDLSIAGVCRMCMVEIEKVPRLQISCNTTVSEGMVVRTDTEKVKESVKGALELHLINHPIDCPICDKAGECKLQDFYVDYGLYQSRMDLEEKVHKPKAQDIGTIVLDSERCILCTRCVRFTAEVTKSYELGIFNRGDRSVLSTYNDTDLHNNYTGNLADICPVGALTAKDFRFQCRVWFLDKTPSVCTQCARGCNTTISVKPNTNVLYRVEPRRNPDVNSSWICDTGRWDYHYLSRPNRTKVPMVKTMDGRAEESWNIAFKKLHEKITSAPDQWLVALSTQLTNEEIVDALDTLGGLGVKQYTWVVDEGVVHDRKPADGILKHEDLTPNAMGFELVMKKLGVPWLKMAEARKLLQGKVANLLILGLEGEHLPGLSTLLEGIKSVSIVAHATNEVPMLEQCDWILPNVSSYEKSGTVVNALGRVQRLNAAIPAQHTARDAHGVVFGLQSGGDRESSPSTRFRDVYDGITGKILFPSGAPNWFAINTSGVPIAEATT